MTAAAASASSAAATNVAASFMARPALLRPVNMPSAISPHQENPPTTPTETRPVVKMSVQSSKVRKRVARQRVVGGDPAPKRPFHGFAAMSKAVCGETPRRAGDSRPLNAERMAAVSSSVDAPSTERRALPRRWPPCPLSGNTEDLRPGAIIDELDLRRPIYRKTAAYGHFGRELPEFTWEKTDKAEELKAACGIA